MSEDQQEKLLVQSLTAYVLFTLDLGSPLDLATLKRDLEREGAFRKVYWDALEGRMYNPLYYEEIEPPLIIDVAPLRVREIDKRFWKEQILPTDAQIAGPLLYTKVLKEGVLEALTNLTIAMRVKVYPAGIATVSVPLELSGRFEADHIVGLLNPLIYADAQLVDVESNQFSLRELALRTVEAIRKLAQIEPRLSGSQQARMDEYTILHLHKLTPALPGHILFKRYFDDFKGLAVRCIKHYRDLIVRVDEPGDMANFALETQNIFTVLRRNATLYTPLYHQRYVEEVFYAPLEALRAQLHLLRVYHVSLIHSLGQISSEHLWRAREVEKGLIQLEQLRREILDSLHKFRRFTAIAYRIRHVFDCASSAFRLREMESLLVAEMNDFDELVTRVHEELTRQRSERMTLAMNVLSVIFAGSLALQLAPTAIGILQRFGWAIPTTDVARLVVGFALWVVVSGVSLLYVTLVGRR